MELPGRVENGVIVLANGCPLPEGTAVTVVCALSPLAKAASEKQRVQLPLVRTGEVGTLDLTNERIAEILDDEDIASSRH
jgi:hypothetical protein